MNPVTAFVVMSKPQGNAMVLRWVNPTDDDFAGVKVYRKVGSAITGSNPGDDTDSVLIYDGTQNYIIDWGRDLEKGSLKNSIEYYYSAWAYDAVPTYSTKVSTNGNPEYTVTSDNIFIPSELKVILENGLINHGYNEFECREANSIDPNELGEKDIILIHPLEDTETQRNIGDESHSVADPDDPGNFLTYIGGLYEWTLIIRPISLNAIKCSHLYLDIKKILYENWDRMTAIGCISRQIAGMGWDDDLSGSLMAKPVYSRPIRLVVGYDFLVAVKDPDVDSVTMNYTYV